MFSKIKMNWSSNYFDIILNNSRKIGFENVYFDTNNPLLFKFNANYLSENKIPQQTKNEL